MRRRAFDDSFFIKAPNRYALVGKLIDIQKYFCRKVRQKLHGSHFARENPQRIDRRLFRGAFFAQVMADAPRSRVRKRSLICFRAVQRRSLRRKDQPAPFGVPHSLHVPRPRHRHVAFDPIIGNRPYVFRRNPRGSSFGVHPMDGMDGDARCIEMRDREITDAATRLPARSCWPRNGIEVRETVMPTKSNSPVVVAMALVSGNHQTQILLFLAGHSIRTSVLRA